MSPEERRRNDDRRGHDRKGGFSKGKRDGQGRPRDGQFRERRGPRADSKGPRRDFHKGPRTERPPRPAFVISTDPQKLLFKGVDFQTKGEDSKALLLFLHGSALMSKGCENNAMNILRDAGKEGSQELRERIAKDCSVEALIEFDYLCKKIDNGYDCSYLDSEYSKNNIRAIYRMICLDKVGPEDPVIDILASSQDDQLVTDGLRQLIKRKESKKAEQRLKLLEERKERKQYVHTAFVRAMKGDQKSKRDLEKLSKEFPEAAFFSGYVKAREEGNSIPWLKEKYPQFGDLIISEEFNLRIGDTDYGMYLHAMKIKSRKEDWIPSMIKAAKNGSKEAMDELQPLMYKTEIKKAVANIHLMNSDLQGLVDDWVNGLDETYYLDKYCESVPERIVEVGKRIGSISPEREIDWLRAHAFMVECRDALTVRAEDERYHCRKMIYALHDVGRDMEAADLYFSMKDHPDLPAVKWLAKVCRNEDAKEYVRSHFESEGDLETFEQIFVDDGYRKRPKGIRKKR